MKIVYVEDGDFRYSFAPSLLNGLKQDGVEIAIRETLDESIEELEQGNLADVYILDNEILPGDMTGAEFALKIKEKARALGKEVLVISLLCSNPDEVRKEFGPQFTEYGIPVLSKNYHAAFCAFFVGACIREGKALQFEQWLQREEFSLPEPPSRLSDKFMVHVEMNPIAGGYYLQPKEYLDQNRERIERGMHPEALRELNRLFPRDPSRGIERM